MSGTIAELLSDFGIETQEPLSPEQDFYRWLVYGPMPRMANIKHWLQHEMCVIGFLQDKGAHILKQGSKIGGAGLVYNKVPVKELARNCLHYYLLLYHKARFVRTDGREACDIEKVLDLVVEHELIKKLIAGEKNS